MSQPVSERIDALQPSATNPDAYRKSSLLPLFLSSLFFSILFFLPVETCPTKEDKRIAGSVDVLLLVYYFLFLQRPPIQPDLIGRERMWTSVNGTHKWVNNWRGHCYKKNEARLAIFTALVLT